MRKLIWLGIILGLVPLYMGSACGGYAGWPGLTTSGGDAKLSIEISNLDPGQLDNGLFTFYVNYNNVGQQAMKTVSTFRDGTAPFGLFTSDGNLEQHFNDHVGVLIAQAYDKDGDGVICWQGCFSNDYTIPNAFCPAVGGTGTTSASNGFSAYCNKGLWQLLFANPSFEETKQTVPGSKFSNALGAGSNFSPITIGQILATSTLGSANNKTGSIVVKLNGLSLPNGASHTLASPASVTVYGYGHGIAIDATQPGLKDAAAWLASQWAGQPDGATNVTLSLNGGGASGTVKVASGANAALALQSYAGR